ncbi:MAG TPA: hypothetical protein VIE37_12500 [Methylomirabilota bacterium]|jgi:hypothetical protein
MNSASGPHLSSDDFDAWMSGAPSAEARAHLVACPECRERAEAEREIVAMISALPLMSPAEGFADRVMQRVAVPDPFFLRSIARIRQRLLATRRTAVLAATLALVVVGSMAASIVWSLGHQQTLAAMGTWLMGQASQVGWIGIRGIASNLIEQPWYSPLRDSLAHPALLGAASAFAFLLYIGGIVALRRLLTVPTRQVAHAHG